MGSDGGRIHKTQWLLDRWCQEQRLRSVKEVEGVNDGFSLKHVVSILDKDVQWADGDGAPRAQEREGLRKKNLLNRWWKMDRRNY